MTATASEKQTKKTAEKPQPEPEHVPDLEAIVPEPGELEVEGVPAQVKRLKAFEFLALMRCITRGLGGGLASVRIDTSDSDAMQQDIAALMFAAIPNAIGEFGQFLFAIVEPRDTATEDQKKALQKVMRDPEIETLMDVLGVMILQEKDDLAVLAGKAQAWLAKIQKTMNQTKPETTG